MANATVYVDGTRADDTGDGLSEATAKKTISAALALLSGGGNLCYVKASATYTVTSTLTVAVSGDATDGPNVVEGYATTPGARDGRPTVTSSTSSVHLFTMAGTDYWVYRHLRCTHSGGTRGAMLRNTTGDSTGVKTEDCVVDGCLAVASIANNMSNFAMLGGEVCNTTDTTSATTTNNSSSFYGVDIHDNAGAAVQFGFATAGRLHRCVVDTNLRGVYIGSNAGYANVVDIAECLFVDNTNSGFESLEASGAESFLIVNSVFWGNGAYGIRSAQAAAKNACNGRGVRNNYFGGNTSGDRSGFSAGLGDVTGIADPFASRAGRNFAPNNTSGAGALIRGVAMPTAFSTTTTNNLDGGPVQHQDAGGGSVPMIGSPLIRPLQ